MRRIVNLLGDMLEYRIFRQKIFDIIALAFAIVFVIAVFGLMKDIQGFMRMWGLSL